MTAGAFDPHEFARRRAAFFTAQGNRNGAWDRQVAAADELDRADEELTKARRALNDVAFAPDTVPDFTFTEATQ